MICVSIGRTRHKMVVAEHRALAAEGAELVELRLDWLSRMPNLARLVENRPTPVVITCRRQSDRGRWRGNEEQRITLMRAAIVQGVEYVDLEADIAKKIPRYGDTKRIVSFHDFDETPEFLWDIHQRLCKLDPDIVKIVTMANSPADMVRMLQVVKESKVPTIGFCMGELGIASRILCGKFGAPFTYATFSSERELAPGQLSFKEMVENYHYSSINSDTRIFGVVGDPISHSLSPLVHNSAFQHSGINSVYVPFRVAKHALTETLNEFEWLDIQGISVTIPHKEEIVARATHRDQSVKQIGAANTMYRDQMGKWCATNTDYDAALQTLRLGVGADAMDETALAGRGVLMLGAGGVARAIGRGIIESEASLTIASRSHKRAVELAEQIGCRHVTWENRGSVLADILVNCTPVGMHPNVDQSPFEPNWIRDEMLVFDTIYNPESTFLLKQARTRGCATISGIEMFIRQAAMQFNYFTNEPAPLDFMRETIRNAISAVRK